jgi:hypothetical protein
MIETRVTPPDDKAVGFVLRNALSYHDPAFMGKFGNWYFDKDSEWRLAKTLLLWPTLFVGPVISTKNTVGGGMRIRLGSGPIAPSLEGGFHTSVWTHFSQKKMPFDLCLGSWGSFQMSLGKRVGLGVRATYDLPVYHALSGLSKGIVGGSFMMTYIAKPAALRKGPATQVEKVPAPEADKPMEAQPVTEPQQPN